MAKLKRKRKTKHSPAGLKYLKGLEARGLKLKRGRVKKTLATAGIEDKLRRAGLTEKEIARLR